LDAAAMSLRYLIDTNVLIYPHDVAEPAKSARAIAVLSRVNATQRAALPAQVLAEFANVALKKFKPRLEPDAVHAQIGRLMRMFPVLPLTPATVLEAVRGVRDHQLAYYDAQIWAVAKLAQLTAILSEDFNAGAVIEGVTFIDPFDPTFVVEDLG
jgi:predicted nucleic acid-binding protein